VVSLPLLGMAWVLAVLSVSERLPLLSYLLSAAVLAHAMFALIGYCFLNTRVRRNLYISLLRCVGKKVPLDSSEVTTGGTSSHSHQGGSASQQHSVWKNSVFIFYFTLTFIRFEVVIVVMIHDVVFWGFTHFSLVGGHRCVGRTCSMQHAACSFTFLPP
jgi:hypothetical protein